MKRRARLIGIAPVLGEWRMGPVEKISEQRLAVLSFQNRNQRAWTALIISSKGTPAYKNPFSFSLHPAYLLVLLYIKIITGLTFF